MRKYLKDFKSGVVVFLKKTSRHVYAIAFSASEKRVLWSISTNSNSLKKENLSKLKSAQVLATSMSEYFQKHAIKEVAFLRGQYQYHGCIKTFVETLRSAGIKV